MLKEGKLSTKLWEYYDKHWASTLYGFTLWHLQNVLISDYFKVLMNFEIMDPNFKLIFYNLHCMYGDDRANVRFECIMGFKPYCLFEHHREYTLNEEYIVSKRVHRKNIGLYNIKYYEFGKTKKIHNNDHANTFTSIVNVLETFHNDEFTTDLEKMLLLLC